MRLKASSAGLICRSDQVTTPKTAKQLVIKIPDQPQETIENYEGKDFEKGRLYDENRKHHEKCQQSVKDEKSWEMMMHQGNTEHEE